MLQIVNRLVCIALLVFVVSGCATPSAKFDYSEGTSETASLIVPRPLRVVSFDGREVNLPMSVEYPYTLTLPAGEHTVEFLYRERWGLGRDNELMRGPVMLLEFALQGGEQYQLDFLRPESVEDEELFDVYTSAFSAWLLDGQGQRVKEASSTDVQGNLGRKIASIREGNAIAATKPVAVSQSVAVVDSSETKTTDTPPAGKRLQSLQELWQSASDEEKKEFMQWVVVPGS